MGTRIQNLQVTKVVDGDTIKLLIDGKEETLRIIAVDTEESWPGSSKPVTQAGLMASQMAKEYFKTSSGDFVEVDIEFDTNDPAEMCLKKHRGNYGRLICYVHKDGENFNLKLIEEGWSPYFVKYGRSRIYHEEFTKGEAEAQANNLVIWDPLTNAGGPFRDYSSLIPWWSLRAQIIEDYRKEGMHAGVLSVRLDYPDLLEAAEANDQATIFCDLQGGIHSWPGNGALIYAGSKFQKFNLWIPDARSDEAAPLVRLIEKRYVGNGRGYVYVTGRVEKYRNIPEIVLTEISQLSDFPPK
ncbi:MAG: nuclease [Desulfuromonadales bacterium C00003096]|jgi:micrococcal nuclease|nr:MAG: nuclease [Desulfuromonadales bacterium C00003096]